jgi:hypothetical protein
LQQSFHGDWSTHRASGLELYNRNVLFLFQFLSGLGTLSKVCRASLLSGKQSLRPSTWLRMAWSGGLAQEIWSGLAWTRGMVKIRDIYLMLEYTHSWILGVFII